jgi:hypothetical protein
MSILHWLRSQFVTLDSDKVGERPTSTWPTYRVRLSVEGLESRA